MENLPFYGEEASGEVEASTERKGRNNSSNLETLNKSYVPLHLDELWFYSKSPADNDELLTLSKYKAIAEFKKQNFSDSMKLFEQCEELLPANANALRREVFEGKARCLIELQEFQEAENVINFMFDQKGNPQDSSLWFLLSSVHEKMRKWTSVMACLQQCLILHSDCTVYWSKLAHCIAQLTCNGHREMFTNFIVSDKVTNYENLSSWSTFRNALKYFYEYFIGQIKQGQTRLGENFSDNTSKDNCSSLSFLSIALVQQFTSIIKDINAVFTSEYSEDERDLVLKHLERVQDSGNCFCSSGIVNGSISDQDEVQFMIWKISLQCLHCCVAAKSCLLAQKAIQYSKGFAKNAAKHNIISIEKYASDLLSNESNLQKLSDILDNPECK
eukprot:gene4649-5257_t